MISNVGFEPQDLSISGQTNVNVALKASTAELNEVVVTALGIKKERKALGYSITR